MSRAALDEAERACAGGDCEKAISLFELAMTRHPHDFRLHYRLGLCYGGDCSTHAMVHSEMAVAYLRHARRLMDAAPVAFRAAVVDQLANALCHCGTATAIREAIECYLEAAEIYQKLGMGDDWSRAQFNLGNSFCDLSELAKEDHWQEAVTHYQESLRVRTREKDPERHAAALENLGSAYRRLSAGGSGENIKRSIQCYHRALRVYTPGFYRDKKAAVENNIGNAYLSLPAAEETAKARNARRALRHFDRALCVQTGNKSSRDYGITQYNRAQAYFRLAQASSAAATCLEEALAAFQSCGESRYTELAQQLLKTLR